RGGGQLLRGGAAAPAEAPHIALRARHHRHHGRDRRVRRGRARVGDVRHLPPGQDQVTARRGGERGETLVELLISIIIMASAIIAIVAAIAVATNSSDEHKKQVGVVVVLRDYAEAVMNSPYQGCNYPLNPQNYVPAGYTDPAGYHATVTAVRSYDGNS